MVEDLKKDTLLYAGTLQVRITDWFFFKDKADLKYIALENAVINLQRTDSVWNYAYLEKYFSGGGSSGKKSSAGIEFNLRQVRLRNVAFNQKDGWVGKDMYVRIAAMDMDANDISLSRKVIDIPGISLQQPYFHLFNYDGRRPPRAKRKTTPTTPANGLEWNTEGWKVHIGSITIKNGDFRNDNDSLNATTAFFDGQHIDFNRISGSIKNFRFTDDTVRYQVDLSTRERSGLMVQSLKARATMHPHRMEFANLYLKTNRSLLQDYFSMQYKSMEDMSDFIHAVRMTGRFRSSTLFSDDIAFFAPAIRDWNRNIQVSGTVEGTVDDLTGKNLRITSGNSTAIRGDVNIIGLPDINKTFINLKAEDLQTTYRDAVSFVPALRKVTAVDLPKLEYLKFKGTYTGFLSDFVTFGRIQTALGTLVTDLNMKLPAHGDPVYSGSVSADNFELGRFLKTPQLGAITFAGDIKGRGFVWNRLDLDVDGFIKKIRYDQYTYQNITANGRLSNRMFDGRFVIQDPNADARLNGVIDLRGAQPLFNMEADITRLNLKPLQFFDEDLRISGKFNLNFQGNSIEDFIGDARINRATFVRDGKEIVLDSLVLRSSYANGIRTLRASATELVATVTGKFDLKSLPDAVTLFLSRYYPSYIRKPRRAIPSQSFTFDIRTHAIEDYVQLLDRRFTGFNNSHISGGLDIGTNAMRIDADIPGFGFTDRYRFSDVRIRGKGNLDSLSLEGSVNNAAVSDSLIFPQTNFSIVARNDISDINITTTANQTINQASLSTQMRTFSDGAHFLFNPSSFVLNGKKWTIEPGGELNFRRNTVVQGQLVLRESNQEIQVTTVPSEQGDNWNDLHINVRNLNLGDVSPFVLPNNRLEGLLTGEITIEDPQRKFNVSADLRTDELRLDNDSIGQVRATVNYNNITGLLTGNGANTDPDHQVRFDLAMDLKDSANVFRDRISVLPVNYPVKILERFIGNLFSDLTGYVTGNLDILGEGTQREYVGKARLKDAGLRVNFTQVYYTVEDTEIEMLRDRIDFGTMKLKDKDGNTATVRGFIAHESFSNMVFDLVAKVDGQEMELLNTTALHNQQFYGRAKGTGTLVLTGPQEEMYMDIDLQASRRDSSYITLPPSRSRESGQASFMVERKYGREMTPDDLDRTETNIRFNVHLTANPMVNIEVILDELTGDIIRGRGTTEDLIIRGGTTEPLSITGTYAIEEGNYLFTFQSIFKKPFVLRKGGNSYIKWTGDPYDADIRFDAMFEAKRVDFAPLASGFVGDELNLSKRREDVNVMALLTGKLFQPIFNFDLEFPNQQLASNPAVQFGLQQIKQNPNELNKQVTYLIVFNSFAPIENGTSSGQNTLYEFSYNTLSGLLFGEVNRRLNQLLGKILRNNDLTVNFTGSLYNNRLLQQNTRGFQINQSNVNFSVGMPLLNDRFQITFGSTLNIPLGTDIEAQVQFLPDVSLEWMINKSGTIRATFFYRQNLDFLGSSTSGLRTQRSGASIAYRREFDSILRRKEKKKTGTDSLQKETKSQAAAGQ